MIKVNYDPQTTLVSGYYPDSINYSSIPEPFIEIEDEEQDNSKQMCVIGGVYQEYVKPLNIQLQEAKTSKLSQLESARKEFQYKNIELNGETYVASKIACDNLSGAIDVMIDNNLVQTNWINANDEAIILTLVEARNLRTAMFSQQSSAYFQELAFKEDINACITIEELNAININFE